MTTQNTVRTVNRSALRGSVALIFASGALLVCTGSRALNGFRPNQQNPVQDTVQLTALLTKVRGADPTVCHLIGRALENRWGPHFGGNMIDPASTGVDDVLIDWINSSIIDRNLIPQLRRGLNDADGCVRRTAAHLLGRSRAADLSAELRAELVNSAAPTREAALLALGYFDRPSGIDAAQSGMRDADANVRVAAAWALGMIESTAAIPALTAATRDPDPRMRRTVAWALGTIESSSAVPALSTMLADADVTVRIQAAYALGQIESADAIPALVRLLETDRDPRVRRAAAAALGQISG
jgi:HEAT repeat protein